jgi:hypothetical protein
VHPYVPENPTCRNDFMGWGSQISTTLIYKAIISLLLFFSYFSTRIRFLLRKYPGCGYVIKCPVNGVKRLFGCFPLLYHNYWPVSKFRDYSTKLLSRKNIAPKFKDTECKTTFIPDLSGQSGRRYTLRQALLISEGGAYWCLHRLIYHYIYSYGKLIVLMHITKLT